VSQTASAETVFLFDVDNTLLDNDRVIVDLKRIAVGGLGAYVVRAATRSARRQGARTA
jgi:FMN phosphatase YigB (HAD superfamily)